MRIRLGKVMLTPAGEYNTSRTYTRLDLVYKDDCAYASLMDDNANNPLTDNNYWMLLLDGSFTRRYYEQNGITVASIICNGNATIGGDLTINGNIVSSDLQARLNALSSSIGRNTTEINSLKTRMTNAETNIANCTGGGGSGSIDPAVLSQLRTEISNKVDINYFNRLFAAYNGTTRVLPNDTATAIDNIKALTDFWSEGSVTALGYNSGGSGGSGGTTLLEPLSSINNSGLGTPTTANVGIIWDGRQWTYGSTGGSGGSGSVTSVGLTMPTGFTVSGSPVTSSGTIAVSLASGYTIPLTVATERWQEAWEWGNHASVGYATQSQLSDYLPLTGGVLSGALAVNGDFTVGANKKIHLGQGTYFEDYMLRQINIPNKAGTLAVLSDIPDISTLVTTSYFDRLFVALDSNGNEITPNDTTTTIVSIKARYDFWSTGAISAYGCSSSGSGQGVLLGTLLTSLNNSSLGAPTASEIGKAIVWTDNGWAYGTVSGGSSGITLSDVRSDLQSTSPAYKINAAHIPDLSSTYTTTTVASATYATKTELNSYQNEAILTFAQKATTLAGYGITNAYTKDECDGKYVTIATDQTITGEKTFDKAATFKNNITLNKTTAQQYISFYNGTYEGTYGQSMDGSLYVFSNSPVNWYTSINNHIGLCQLGATGYVGVNNSSPQYNLDVTGTIKASDSVIIGGGKIAWDSTNNALYVQGADGSICHFYSLGGVSALGAGSVGTAKVSSLRVGTLSITDTLKVDTIESLGSSGVTIPTPDDGYYVCFNYTDRQYTSPSSGSTVTCQMTDIYNVGLYGEDDNANETWSIMPDGVAEFSTVKCGGTQLLSDYVYLNQLARLRANGSTVYLETRSSTSASWTVKETWS